jgi:hypothetical protein
MLSDGRFLRERVHSSQTLNAGAAPTKSLSAALLANFLPFTHNSGANRSLASITPRISAFQGGIMPAIRSRIFQFGLVSAAALLASMSPAASQNYTAEQQQACSGDAMRLCGAFVPDVDRITVCMIQNKSQLSPGCRVFFRPDPEPVVARKRSAKPETAGKPAGGQPSKPKKAAKPAAD